MFGVNIAYLMASGERRKFLRRDLDFGRSYFAGYHDASNTYKMLNRVSCGWYFR